MPRRGLFRLENPQLHLLSDWEACQERLESAAKPISTHKGYEKRVLVKSEKKASTPEWEWQVDMSVKTESCW